MSNRVVVLPTIVGAVGMFGLMILESTDYFNGKYDPFGPYPRNPKRDPIDTDVQHMIDERKYKDKRKALLIPKQDLLNPLATPKIIRLNDD